MERQYLASTGEGKPARYQRMLDLARWLKEHVPKEDSSAASGTGLVHGDYRPDNLVFHPTEDRVIGVIDWELSTLGNQMCDVAYSCLPYIIDATPTERTFYGGFQHTGIPDGIPQLEEYLSVYCSYSVFKSQEHRGKNFREEESLTSEKNQGKFVPSEKVMQLQKKLIKFIEDHIYPMEGEFYKHAQSTSRWTIHPEEENLKALAKEGLWNLFIPGTKIIDASKPSLTPRRCTAPAQQARSTCPEVELQCTHIRPSTRCWMHSCHYATEWARLPNIQGLQQIKVRALDIIR
ncbi:unnamed protein product [Miscanthus lutarioriparius]|uniref:Aminoglycoside phosphotransferase domain-containing protein n=1 Tax=Miscanthus lutarioriparius TaxID=422564 RepID=A0A811SMP1_9POAL|nr:unnamed protein product [Miscanthus lutarioriparius]